MSKKLTEKEIEELILEELERLNEFTTKTWNPKDNAAAIRKKLSRTGKMKSPPSVASIKAVAGQDGRKTNLSTTDIDDSITSADPTLDKILRQFAANKDLDNDIKSYITTNLPTPPAAGGSASAELKAATPDAPDVDDQFDDVYGDDLPGTDPIPGIDMDYFAVAGKTKHGKIKATYQNRLKQGTAEIMKAEIAKHGDLVSMLKHYQEIADAAKAAKPGKAIDKLMKDNKLSAADIYNSVQVIATFEDITNNLHGVASGYGFEQLVALMVGGVVFGGSNKAADDLAQNLKDPKADVLLLSAKSAQGSIADQVQSKNTIKDIEKNDTMYYLAFQRGGAAGGGSAAAGGKAGESKTIRVFSVGIRRVSGNGGDKFKRSDFRYVDPITGTTGDKSVKIKKANVIMPVQDYSFNIEIPLLNAGRSLNLMISNAFQKANDVALEQIELIQRNLANLREQTQIFVALRKRGKNKDSLDAAQKGGEAFNNLTNSLAGKGYEMDKSGTKGFFEESKLQSLDQLIAETIRDIKRKKKK